SIFLKKNRNADIRISTVPGVSLHFLQQVPLESLNMRASQAAPTMATSTGLRFVMFLAFVRRVKQVRSAGRGGIARPPFPTMAVLRPIEAQGSVALTESAELDEHVRPGSEGLDR